jgi:hypothetical protein
MCKRAEEISGSAAVNVRGVCHDELSYDTITSSISHTCYTLGDRGGARGVPGIHQTRTPDIAGFVETAKRDETKTSRWRHRSSGQFVFLRGRRSYSDRV